MSWSQLTCPLGGSVCLQTNTYCVERIVISGNLLRLRAAPCPGWRFPVLCRYSGGFTPS